MSCPLCHHDRPTGPRDWYLSADMVGVAQRDNPEWHERDWLCRPCYDALAKTVDYSEMTWQSATNGDRRGNLSDGPIIFGDRSW